MKLLRKMIMASKKLPLCLLLALLFTGFSTLQAQMVTVTPTEFTEGMKNPLMGMREGVSKASSRYPYNTVVRAYVYFNELDNAPTDGLQKILDYTNTKFKDFEKWNIKVIVRVILQYTGTQYYWPADLKSIQGDYTNATLRARVLKLVDNIGKAWDNDPRIAWVEMGLIGQWGEQESPMGIDEPGVKPDGKSWVQILAPAFKAAFPNKKVEARHMSKWDGTGFVGGMYWDSWGSYSSMTNATYDYNAELIKYNNAPYNRYKTSPMGGEIAYSLGVMRPELIGTDANDSYKDAGHRRWIKNVAASIRTSVLGMEYSNTDQSAAALTGLKDLLKGFGYRFLIKEFQCSQQTQPGNNLTVNAKIVNAGVAPFYDKWPVAFVLIDQNTKQIVYKSVIPSADVTTWMPGENYDWKTAATLPGTGTEKYLIPAAINNISATVTIPANLATGTYYAGLAILDPTTNLPGVFFSVNNFFKASNTHPLCQIGIGVAPNNPTLTNVTFDNYDFLTDSRYYSLTPPVNVPVTGVTVAPATLSVGIGVTGQLTPNVLPANASNKNVTWTSNNTSVATVDANGKVTGVSLGNAVVTVKTVDGNFTATCAVTVANIPPTGITIAPTTLTVVAGKCSSLTPYILPTNASNKNVTWTSSNTSIATVNSSGQVCGVIEGNATITVTTVDGGLTATCSVTVVPAPPCNLPWSTPDFTISASSTSYSSGAIDISCATSVKLHMELSETDFFEADDNITVSYKVNGGAAIQIVKLINDFVSNIIDIPTISGNTLEIIVNGVTQEATEIYYIKNVSVTSNAVPVKQDQTITFPAIAAKTFGAADFNPGATASSGLAVTYVSSNTAVATIVSGNIHIVGVGTADITASQAGNANYNAAASVVQTLTVNPAPPSADVVALTAWVSGTNNPKVAGNNRMLVVMVMGENGATFLANSATYGGQTMTRVTDNGILSGSYTYSAIFVIMEAGLNAATSGAINVTWSATPAGSSIYSVLLGNVDQTTAIVKANNALAAATVISTTALSALSGDMVVMCGATANNNTQTFNNSFTKKFESNSSWGDGVGGNKMGTGVSETPKFTQSASGRMVICAIVAKKATVLKSAAIENLAMAIDNKAANIVSVYPNPVTNTLYINHAEGANIRIINTHGQILYNNKVSGVDTNINVAELKTNGLVMVQVIIGNSVSNHKILIK